MQAEMEECIRFIMADLKKRGVPNSHTLAYQSRVGPVEWLKPYTDDSIRWPPPGTPRLHRACRVTD